MILDEHSKWHAHINPDMTEDDSNKMSGKM